MGNGAFYVAVVGFSFLPQFLYVQVVTLLEHTSEMYRRTIYTPFYLP